ncbi:hypothetical protein MM440_12990 [Arsenicicoccus piscis]|uniref:Uncharacterized protein n=1 Tax=Arsenicicoccus piscis TaxID=673954 RepID=A0ABQ6HMP9_9MICO|nr:hypothetical protein [Arsenicicoccus piscis]MCH8628651.1 hypothetical protein [Arsenicicoccus piscis]GMA19417.1 hypothetical protein GCM10025862_14380 [Arsenicicoccus piscis]
MSNADQGPAHGSADDTEHGTARESDPVGEQAAQLTAALREALGPRRAKSAAHAFAAGRSAAGAAAGRAASTAAGHGTGRAQDHAKGRAEDHARDHEAHDPSHERCARDGGTDACQVCPICRAIRIATAVSPDAIDQVADLVTMGADLLRGLAEQGRARRAGATAPERQPDPDQHQHQHQHHHEQHPGEPSQAPEATPEAKPAKTRAPAKNQARRSTKEST